MNKGRVHPKDVGLTLPRYLKKRKPSKKATVSEDTIQKAVQQYLDAMGIRYVRIPNRAYRALFAPTSKVPIHIKKGLADCLKGVPDLLIMKPEGEYNSLLLMELKTEVGTLSHAQKLFSHGVNVVICRSFSEAKIEIDKWRI